MRLANGGRIDRQRPLSFRFDGSRYSGYAGDTLASALLANGVRVVGRSFKYHRPRGIFAAGAEEPNALVRLRTGGRAEPNLKATQVELFDGLEAESQNRWPTLRFDIGRLADLAGPLLPAGFYYKTFMWPRGAWHFYEAAIRRMAGMGRAAEAADPDRYEHMHAHCDVLVVGAGPAGLAAALAAGRSGARVILCDEGSEPGGDLLASDAPIDGQSTGNWLARALAELDSLPEVRVLARTTATGYHDHNFLLLVERVADHLPLPPTHLARQRLWRVRARQVVLATGALERPLAFAGNDRPGVMLAAAARTYVRRYAAQPGRRAVLLTNNSDAYDDFLALREAGIETAAIVDLRPDLFDPAVERARAAGIAVHQGEAIASTRGRPALAGIASAEVGPDGRIAGRLRREIACDLLCVSGGWNPTVHLFSQSGGRLRFEPKTACFVPGEAVQQVRVAGAAAGTFDLADCLTEGWTAGAGAARDAGFVRVGAAGPVAAPARDDRAPLRPLWRTLTELPGGKAFVDLQNDVTAADIRLAAREGFRSVEHLKRYTTAGMGTDQGKTANVAALAILAEELGATPDAVGTTTFRPPYTPAAFGAFAGQDRGGLFRPLRRTPMQSWHEQRGAVFEPVGLWRRPFCFPYAGESVAEAVQREAAAVRRSVGLLDASTLGKIDLQGPDVGRFLDRIYCNRFSNLRVGRCRYGLMANDDGMVFDDGVTTRLAERHWHMTTTSGGAATVLDWLEEWLQTEWPDLKAWCSSVTEAWAVATLAGPHAADVLAEAAPGLPLGPSAFPPMSVREAAVAGLPARIFRVSYTGEPSFEINVRADLGGALWEALLAAGERWGIVPFGLEAMHVLRAEAGFIAVGDETDGTVTPVDLGFGRMVARPDDFIGRRALARTDTARSDRRQLVGLLSDDPAAVLPVGGQVLERREAARAQGFVTSAYLSPTLGRAIALALVERGRERHGERVHVSAGAAVLPARIVPPRFLPEARGDG